MNDFSWGEKRYEYMNFHEDEQEKWINFLKRKKNEWFFCKEK